MLQQVSVPVLLVLFAVGAVVTWLAGVRISIATDVLSTRYHLGEALGGIIFLAVVVNLPEVAIVIAASLSGNVGLAIGNLLGGIAIQTVVLVLLDFAAVHDRPLSFAGAALTLVLQGTFLMAILALTMMGMALRPLVVLRTTPIGLLLVMAWVFGLWMTRAAARGLPWTDKGVPPDLVALRKKDISKQEEKAREEEEEQPIWRVWLLFAFGSLITLAGGVLLERTSERLAELSHLGGVIFGATVLAAITALPEVSTGLESIRLGDYELAFSDIFGSNAFLPALLPLITLLSGKDALAQAGTANLYLCGLGILVTAIYVGGLVFRPQRQYLRLGPDSWSVLVLYILGIAGLMFIR